LCTSFRDKLSVFVLRFSASLAEADA
jgi:hypothetical protein